MKLKRLENPVSVSEDYGSKLASLLGKTIEGFNARVSRDHRIVAHSPPHAVLIAEKESFPAGILIIRLGRDNESLVCSYSYSKNQSSARESHTRSYKIRFRHAAIELCSGGLWVPTRQIAKEVLGPFFERVT